MELSDTTHLSMWRMPIVVNGANVSKSAVVVFARELVEGSWNWGDKLSQDYQSIPT